MEEVGGIFKLLVKYVNKELKNLMKNQVKVNILGDIEPLPDDAKKSCKKVLETTKDNRGINFNIALNYGGREEIRKSCVCLAKKVAKRAACAPAEGRPACPMPSMGTLALGLSAALVLLLAGVLPSKCLSLITTHLSSP